MTFGLIVNRKRKWSFQKFHFQHRLQWWLPQFRGFSPVGVRKRVGTWRTIAKKSTHDSKSCTGPYTEIAWFIKVAQFFWNKIILVSANLQSIERRYAKRYPESEAGYLKSIQHHIEHVCNEKDEAALEDWRGFYRRNLQPLDKKALEIIQKYCHLISTDIRERPNVKISEPLLEVPPSHESWAIMSVRKAYK